MGSVSYEFIQSLLILRLEYIYNLPCDHNCSITFSRTPTASSYQINPTTPMCTQVHHQTRCDQCGSIGNPHIDDVLCCGLSTLEPFADRNAAYCKGTEIIDEIHYIERCHICSIMAGLPDAGERPAASANSGDDGDKDDDNSSNDKQELGVAETVPDENTDELEQEWHIV